MPAVNFFINHFLNMWDESNTGFPVFYRQYSEEEQAMREIRFDGFQKKMKKLQSKKNRDVLMADDPGKTLFPAFTDFMENVFDFEPEHLEIILSDSFKNVSKEFFCQARVFGPELSPENIYQGLRNVWIMNGLQVLMDLPVEITPAIFAYSMIYPYSDNFLDDHTVSDTEKRDFSSRFNQRLNGKEVEPENFTEKQLFRLISLIELQFSRNEFPEVYESLYAIQRGQTRSLELINCNGTEDAVIREICFEKGGASVLADGYLVTGRLSPEQEQALFGYGVYLQLLDDIQDAEEDAKANTKTMFSCLRNPVKKDAYINRTVDFGRKALGELRCFSSTKTIPMLRLMDRSIGAMLIESVGLNPEGYSFLWLNQLERYSPLRFKFIREKKSKSKSQRFDVFRKFIEQVPTDFIPAKSNTTKQTRAG